MRYTFISAQACNMCGSEIRRVLGRRLNKAQGFRPKKRVGIATTVVQCLDCKLIYADPMPIPDSIEQHYSMPPEDYWRPEMFSVAPDFFLAELQKIKQLSPNSKTFLDIGCGLGNTVIAALNNGLDAYGIEGSPSFHARAVERLEDKNRIKLGAVEDAGFPQGSFDIISFGAVLEHLYDPSEAIKKALYWLSPTGVIHVEVPNARYLYSSLMNAYFWLCRTDFVVNISPMHAPFHLYEFTEGSFRKNGVKNGYKIAKLEHYAGIPPLAVTKPIHPILKPIMDATRTGNGLILYLRHSHEGVRV